MKYRTFRNLLGFGTIGVLLSGIGYGVHLVGREPTPTAQPAPAVPAAHAPAPMSTAEIRVVLDKFLSENPDHGTRKSWSDCIPGMPFHAEAVRFPDEDHKRWSSSDPTKWSQIRLTRFTDGRPDEKWLLKEGHTYKREVLGSDGHVTETERF